MITTLRDEFSHFKIIIDTSSSISIFPGANTTNQTNPTTRLSWFNHNQIRQLNRPSDKTIKFRGKIYTWHFYTSDIPHIILGSDFFQQNTQL